MPDIPYDIWECVASYIPDEYLKELYSLNSAFFHASMAARYRTVKLEKFTNLKVIEHLRYVGFYFVFGLPSDDIVRDSDISKFVRRIEFCYHWFPNSIIAGVRHLSVLRLLTCLNRFPRS